jgi:biopolymer transport protein ExbD
LPGLFFYSAMLRSCSAGLNLSALKGEDSQATDADNADALIITVTDTGRLYFGIDPVPPSSLAEKLKNRLSHGAQSLYIKADARAPYAYVVKVFDAARTAGVANVTLLATRPKTTQAGTVTSPEGIELELARRSPAVPK